MITGRAVFAWLTMHLESILAFLGVSQTEPDLRLLDRLIAAYARKIPWESASRIVRKAQVARLEDRPRWPDEFWQQAFQFGTGGTCFESNYAFWHVLDALGYQGYLTINDMGAQVGCHTAIIVQFEDHKRLVDVGIPIYASLPVDHETETSTQNPLQTYTVQPLVNDHYLIKRAPHPNPIIYTLIDRPIEHAAYRAATIADYDQYGLFLDKVILTKVIHERIWRFSSLEPDHLQMFDRGERINISIDGSLGTVISNRFTISSSILMQALALVV
ncbi:MAG: arylamine N-acetyltransferase [Anaerolineae bacterium]|nr:arylamine N-acetyltransferase [Anaerolineae bacterium]